MRTRVIAGSLSIEFRLVFDEDDDRSLRLGMHVRVVRLRSHTAQTLVKPSLYPPIIQLFYLVSLSNMIIVPGFTVSGLRRLPLVVK